MKFAECENDQANEYKEINMSTKELIKNASLLPVVDLELTKAMSKTHPITGPDAEDIRSTNRGLLKFRLELAESTILVDAHQKKVEELKGQSDSLLTEIAKESLKLQKLVDGSFAKSKLDLKDGWRFDGENVCFFRE